MVNKKKSGVSVGKVVAIGAGVAALGATAYYFLGPNGKKNQKATKDWMIEAKKKIIEKVEKTKEMTQEVYDIVIDQVVDPYIKKNAGSVKEIKAFADTVKKQWKDVARVRAAKNKTKYPVKKVVKKVAKKVVKKTVKKVAKKK